MKDLHQLEEKVLLCFMIIISFMILVSSYQNLGSTLSSTPLLPSQGLFSFFGGLDNFLTGTAITDLSITESPTSLIFWTSLGIIIFALLSIILHLAKKGNTLHLRLEEVENLHELENWVKMMVSSGYTEVEIKEKIAQQGEWEPEYIELIFHRHNLLQRLKEMYAIPTEKIKKLRTEVIRYVRAGKSKRATLRTILKQGWPGRKLLKLYIISFYEINKKKMKKLQQKEGQRKQKNEALYEIEIPEEVDYVKVVSVTAILVLVLMAGIIWLNVAGDSLTSAQTLGIEKSPSLHFFSEYWFLLIIALIFGAALILFLYAYFHKHKMIAKQPSSEVKLPNYPPLKQGKDKKEPPLYKELEKLNAEIKAHCEGKTPLLPKHTAVIKEVPPKKKKVDKQKPLPQVLNFPKKKLTLDQELAEVEKELVNLRKAPLQRGKVVKELPSPASSKKKNNPPLINLKHLYKWSKKKN